MCIKHSVYPEYGPVILNIDGSSMLPCALTLSQYSLYLDPKSTWNTGLKPLKRAHKGSILDSTYLSSPGTRTPGGIRPGVGLRCDGGGMGTATCESQSESELLRSKKANHFK